MGLRWMRWVLFVLVLANTVSFSIGAAALELQFEQAFAPIVDCEIEASRQCLIDTGSSFALVLESPLRVPPERVNSQRSDAIAAFVKEREIHGVNGSYQTKTYRFKSVKVASLEFADVLIEAPSENFSEGYPFDAVIGLPLLGDRFQFGLSFFNSYMKSFDHLPTDLKSYPLWRTDSGHVVIEVEFLGKTRKAILDSGSSVTVISRKLAREIEVDLLEKGRDTRPEFNHGVRVFGSQVLIVGNIPMARQDLYLYDTDSFEALLQKIDPEIEMILGWAELTVGMNGASSKKWWFDLEQGLWTNKAESRGRGGNRVRNR